MKTTGVIKKYPYPDAHIIGRWKNWGESGDWEKHASHLASGISHHGLPERHTHDAKLWRYMLYSSEIQHLRIKQLPISGFKIHRLAHFALMST